MDRQQTVLQEPGEKIPMKQIPLRVRIKREAVSQVIEIPKMYFGGDTTWFVRK